MQPFFRIFVVVVASVLFGCGGATPSSGTDNGNQGTTGGSEGGTSDHDQVGTTSGSGRMTAYDGDSNGTEGTGPGEGNVQARQPASPPATKSSVGRGGARVSSDPTLVYNWHCQGRTEHARVREILDEEQEFIVGCYEDHIIDNHVEDVNLSISIRIGRDGDVEETVLNDSLGNENILSCVDKRARALRFPKVRYGACVAVTVPLRFTIDYSSL